ncbi:nucleoside recognition domain-containing protein, partial [Citrobacter portucalensis]
MTTQVRKNVMDMFIDGARRGFTIATTSLLPNVVMAFVIIQALKVTGLLEVVGRVCEPVMALWGLPGESATVLLAAVMSMGGGVGVCASLVVAGTLSGHDATVLLPAIYLM